MRTAIFVSLILATTALSTVPFIFTWANRIEPWLLGLPFAFAWHIGLALLNALLFACWYLSDSRNGVLDVDVTATEQKP